MKAYMSLCKGYVLFQVPKKSLNLRSFVSAKMKAIINITAVNDGFITALVLYEGIGVVEEYFDFNDSLQKLGMGTHFLKRIRRVELLHRGPGYKDGADRVDELFMYVDETTEDRMHVLRVIYNRNRKYRSVYVYPKLVLLSTTMPPSIIHMYEDSLQKWKRSNGKFDTVLRQQLKR